MIELRAVLRAVGRMAGEPFAEARADGTAVEEVEIDRGWLAPIATGGAVFGLVRTVFGRPTRAAVARPLRRKGILGVQSSKLGESTDSRPIGFLNGLCAGRWRP